MVSDEQRAKLERLAQEWEARVRMYMEATEDSLIARELEEYRKEASELAEYLEEETRG